MTPIPSGTLTYRGSDGKAVRIPLANIRFMTPAEAEAFRRRQQAERRRKKRRRR